MILSDPWHSLHSSFGWIEPHRIPEAGYDRTGAQTDCYIAYWVEQGRLQLFSKGQSLEATDGEWLFQYPCPPGQPPYSFHWQPHSTGFEVAFHLRWEGPGHLLLPSKKVLWKSPALPQLNQQTWQLYEHAHALFPIVGHPSSLESVTMQEHFQLRREFHLWFMVLVKEWDRMESGINHVINVDEKIAVAERILQTHPWKESLTIRELAQKSGFSAKHFTLLFRQYYGCSPLAYRMGCKQDWVIRMLQTSDLSIGEIARRCGLTQTWLGIWIRQQTGKTPSEIRRGADSGRGR